jgi:hypothetical protein
MNNYFHTLNPSPNLTIHPIKPSTSQVIKRSNHLISMSTIGSSGRTDSPWTSVSILIIVNCPWSPPLKRHKSYWFLHLSSNSSSRPTKSTGVSVLRFPKQSRSSMQKECESGSPRTRGSLSGKTSHNLLDPSTIRFLKLKLIIR